MASINKKFVVKNGLRSESGDVIIENGGAFSLQNTSDVESFNIDGNTGIVTLGSGATDWTLPAARGSNNGYFLRVNTATGAADWAEVPSGTFSITDGTNTDIFVNGETLTFTGGTGLTSTVANNQVTFDLDNTTVTAQSYGAAGSVATFTVDAQGRLTAASNVAISITESQISDLRAYLLNVVEDTTPQLGGDLDLNSNDITGTGNIDVTGTVTASGNATFGGSSLTIGDATNAGASATISGPGTITIDPYEAGANGTVVIAGDLTVQGTTTTVNSTTVEVTDLNLTLGADATNAAEANGGGITVGGANATFTYDSATDTWTANKDITVDIIGTVSDISNHDTGDLTEGTNLYYLDSRARAAISHVDAGGDGSLSYDSATGVITYTGPSAAEVRAHFSEGTGVDILNGSISIGQDVATTANVSFNVVTADLAGNADTASAWETGRTVTFAGGDVTGSFTIDGSADVGSIALTIGANSVALGTDTTGDYVESLVAGTGIAVANNSGEGATPSITNTDRGSQQFIFKNIVGDSGTNIVADDNNDTLTIVGDNGLVTVTAANTDTLTIETSNTVNLGTSDTAIAGNKASHSVARDYEVGNGAVAVAGTVGSKLVIGASDSADATSRHIIEVLVMTDGADTFITQYGEVYTSAALFTITGSSTTPGDVTITPLGGKTIVSKVQEQLI